MAALDAFTFEVEIDSLQLLGAGNGSDKLSFDLVGSRANSIATAPRDVGSDRLPFVGIAIGVGRLHANFFHWDAKNL